MKLLTNILGYTGFALFVIGAITGENFLFYTGTGTIIATAILNK